MQPEKKRKLAKKGETDSSSQNVACLIVATVKQHDKNDKNLEKFFFGDIFK